MLFAQNTLEFGKFIIMIEKNLIRSVKNKIKNENIKIICIDGISCSGKTYFSMKLKEYLKNKNKNIQIVSKDLFLYSRKKRIKLISKFLFQTMNNQDELHYDIEKINLLLLAIKNKQKVKFKNLYNRKNGKNDLKMVFNFKKKKLIILEGLYFLKNIESLRFKTYSIFIFRNIYSCLVEKIFRIRDKKISIKDVIAEFTNLHLMSFLYYLKKYDFNLCLEFSNNKFINNKFGKKKQLLSINSFQKKHKSIEIKTNQ